MGTLTGSIGSSGNTTGFAGKVDTGCTCPAGYYPSRVQLTDIKSGGAYWYNQHPSSKLTGTLQICDKDKGNKKKVISVTLAAGASTSSSGKDSGTISGTTGLAGKKIYFLMEDNPAFIVVKNKTAVKITTTAMSYTITCTNDGHGTCSYSGTAATDNTITLSNSPSTGYHFSSYTITPSVTLVNNTFTMPASAVTVKANFAINTWTLTLTAGTGGTVSGGGSKNYGSSVTITATPSTGYTFSKWTPSGCTLANVNSASTTLTMPNANCSASAAFNHTVYTLTVSAGTGGTATKATTTPYYNTTIAITATPSTGYTFNQWTTTGGTIADRTKASTTITMPNGNATVTASFNHTVYTLTVNANDGGTATKANTTPYYNTAIAITATPSTGYTFNKWTTTGGTLANANAASTTITMPNGNATVTASFTHVSYTLSSAVSPSGGGSVTLGATSAYYNGSVNITAIPSTGYAFSKWTTTGGTLGNANTASTTITMPAANTTVTAEFTKINYSITTAVNPLEAGTVTANPSTANIGDTVTLTATSSTGYAFDNYTTNPVVTVENNQFTMPASNVAVTGNFHVTNSTGVLNKSNYSGGDTAVLTITSFDSSFNHKYKLSFGDDMETSWIDVIAGVTEVNIYIPVEWSMHIVSGTSVSNGTLYLQTYNNGTYLGSYQIDNLTYTAIDNTIPKLKVYRSSIDGKPIVNGNYGKYQITMPESIETYSITSDFSTVSNPDLTGFILPNNKKSFSVGSNHLVRLTITYGNESFYIEKDLPKVIAVTKRG